ncbi:hypothetical protein F441_08880 [Phytophthora nicotianae CJ01A1]|uniref:Uncharacterized protein n=3 Tax=Phytophthora nicotianae TaxID=4792 RepID=V9F6N3_PHYNI|nr:hypothetical protein F443_08903 [Phytophthora nicotianae P1569]ETL93223.1 hypothetical protein L917_08566 [Phytophthora nicotianae]ETP16532.1 hypothetical protein F441_08880 [Phytophthora nicotianae CJ01A1]
MSKWLNLEPDWLYIDSKEELSKDMSIDNDKRSYWSLLGLYKNIDVLRWFREDDFPPLRCWHLYTWAKSRHRPSGESFLVCIVVGPLRARTDHRRAEKQLLLRHNR